MQALHDFVILVKEQRPERTGSIFLPVYDDADLAETPPYAGTIVSIGPKAPPELQPGVRVAFGDMNAKAFEYEDQLFVLLKVGQITAILKKDLQVL